MRRAALLLASGLAFLAIPSCSLNPQPLPPDTPGVDAATNGRTDALAAPSDAARDGAGGGPFDVAQPALDGESAEAGGPVDGGDGAVTDAPTDALDGGNPDASDAKD
jgi:hypothetical protein